VEKAELGDLSIGMARRNCEPGFVVRQEKAISKVELGGIGKAGSQKCIAVIRSDGKLPWKDSIQLLAGAEGDFHRGLIAKTPDVDYQGGTGLGSGAGYASMWKTAPDDVARIRERVKPGHLQNSRFLLPTKTV
jgi:hypothetical protein